MVDYYYYYFGVRCTRPGESEDTLSVQRHQPHTTKPWKEEKDKTVGDKKRKRSCQQESIGSARETRKSHTIKHRVTNIAPKRHREGTKLLRYWEVLQRGGANECLWATKAPRVTRAGKAMHRLDFRGCILLLLILNPNQPHLLNKYHINMGFSHFRNLGSYLGCTYWHHIK